MTIGLPHLSQTFVRLLLHALDVLHLLRRLLEILLELLPELIEGVEEVVLALLDLVELGFEGGRVLDVHDVLEVLDEQIGHEEAELGGVELGLALLHVVAGFDGPDDGRVGRRTPDPVLLELLHQARLAEARRRLGEMLVGVELLEGEAIPLLERRELGRRLLRRGVVRARPGSSLGFVSCFSSGVSS
jgi:hypothetical protein